MHTHRARRRCYATLNPKPRLWRSAVVHICVLAAVFSRRAASIIHPSRDLSVLQYVFRGWRMLLINLLLTSLEHHALESSTWSRMALSLALVLAIDLLGLASRSLFQDVRGHGRKYGNPFFQFDRAPVFIFFKAPGSRSSPLLGQSACAAAQRAARDPPL